MHLRNDELERIQQYVVENGLNIPEVRDDVVDHLCCLVEDTLMEGGDFEAAFQAARQLIPQNDIQQIQNDTIYFLTIKKQLTMIKGIFITAYISAALLVFGLFFTFFGYVLELPDIIGFAMVLGSAATFALGFLPALLLHRYKGYIDGIKA